MSHSFAFKRLMKLLQKAGMSGENFDLKHTERPPSSLTRRSFIKGLMAAGAAGALNQGGVITAQAFAATGRKIPRIAVIGGGLAGLNAAYYLHKAGFTAHIYEASNRIGGRVLSRQGAVGGNLAIDLGAELINTDHKDMMALVRDFDVKLFNRAEDAEKQPYSAECFYFDGKRISEEDVARDLKAIAEQIGKDAALLDEDFATYAPIIDQMSVREYLDRHADKMPKAYIRLLLENSVRSEFGVEPEESSALQLIYNLPTVDGDNVEILGESDEVFSVIGGTEKIIEPLGKILNDRISLKKELAAVRKTERGYDLEFTSGDKVETDYVVFAVPFTVLRNVKIEAPLPDRLTRFIDEVDLGLNEKVIAGFNTKQWRNQDVFSLGLWNDKGYSQVWDESQRHSDKKEGALTFYLGGEQVSKASLENAKINGNRFVGTLSDVVPGIKDEANGQYLMTGWNANRFTKGAYVNYRPGQITAFGDYFWVESDDAGDRQEVAVENLIFTGEHLSDEYYGFMNGAAQTGRLAAMYIMNKLGQEK